MNGAFCTSSRASSWSTIRKGSAIRLGMSGNRLEVNVHVITGAVTSAQNIIKSVNRAGLDVVDIIQPLASSEAVLSAEERSWASPWWIWAAGRPISPSSSTAASGIRPSSDRRTESDEGSGHRVADVTNRRRKIKVQHGIARTELVHGHQMVEVPSVGDRPPRQFTRRDIAEILEPRVEEMFDLVKREIVRAGYEGCWARAL